MIWNQDDPLHKEIMEANVEAIQARELAKYRKAYKDLIASLPWYLRAYVYLVTFIGRL